MVEDESARRVGGRKVLAISTREEQVGCRRWDKLKNVVQMENFELQLHRFRKAVVRKNRSREPPFWTLSKESTCIVGRHA